MSHVKGETLLSLIPTLKNALDEKDFVSLIEINEQITEIIQKQGIDQDDLLSNKESYQTLYMLIRKAEALVERVRTKVSEDQVDLNKKRKSSKSYRDIGKL